MTPAGSNAVTRTQQHTPPTHTSHMPHRQPTARPPREIQVRRTSLSREELDSTQLAALTVTGTANAPPSRLYHTAGRVATGARTFAHAQKPGSRRRALRGSVVCGPSTPEWQACHDLVSALAGHDLEPHPWAPGHAAVSVLWRVCVDCNAHTEA